MYHTAAHRWISSCGSCLCTCLSPMPRRLATAHAMATVTPLPRRSRLLVTRATPKTSQRRHSTIPGSASANVTLLWMAHTSASSAVERSIPPRVRPTFQGRVWATRACSFPVGKAARVTLATVGCSASSTKAYATTLEFHPRGPLRASALPVTAASYRLSLTSTATAIADAHSQRRELVLIAPCAASLSQATFAGATPPFTKSRSPP